MDYFDKDQKIIELIRNRKVLHLGAIGFTDTSSKERAQLYQKTLHYKLTSVCDVIGLDYARSVIDELKKQGITDTIFYGNVEDLDLVSIDQKFDIIVIGDLIEHLSNPGLMLNGIGRFCNNGTKVIITTPNSFGILSFIRYFFNKFKEGEEHVMTFNRINIENLLVRHNLEISSLDTCHQSYAKSYKILFHIFKKFFKMFPKFGGTLFIVAARSQNTAKAGNPDNSHV